MDWINIKHGLPKLSDHIYASSDKVLIAYKFNDKLLVSTGYLHRDKVRGKEVIRWKDGDGYIMHYEVLYWAPLPEPPQINEED